MESDLQLLNRIGHLLTEEGYKVYGAPGKEEVSLALDIQPYDLVIAAAGHPFMKDPVSLKTLQHKRLSGTVLLVITEEYEETEIVAGNNHPDADAYLNRTFVPDELLEKVKTLLRDI